MTKANYCCHFIKGIRLARTDKALSGMCKIVLAKNIQVLSKPQIYTFFVLKKKEGKDDLERDFVKGTKKKRTRV